MSLLPSLLLSLLALLGGAPPDTTSMTTTVWHRAPVSEDQLAAANKSKSYQVLDQILCSILATNNPWCHLFIHEGNTCVLYDVLVDSLAAPPPEDTATPCMLRNECIVDGIVYPHGDTLYHLGLNTTCWNRALFRTYPVSSTCDAPFSQENFGCVHLHKEAKNWTDARRYCENLEADLAVVPPESFSALQDYIASNVGPYEPVWVGIRANKWLDGRPVASNEWDEGEPHNYYDVEGGAMRYLSQGETPKLWDNGLFVEYFVLCKRT